MSYNYYVSVMNKQEAEEIAKLQTHHQLIKWMEKHKLPFSFEDYRAVGYISVDEIFKNSIEAFEIGDDGQDLFLKKGKTILNGELAKNYEYYQVRYTSDANILEELHNIWLQRLKEKYTQLIADDRTKQYIQFKLDTLEFSFNLPRQDKVYAVTYQTDLESSLYNLTLLRKLFNPEKEVLLSYGF